MFAASLQTSFRTIAQMGVRSMSTQKAPIRVCVTGAAGQIGYAFVPMIANGDMFGPDQPVILQLFDLPVAMEALGGVVMELEDGGYPLLHGIVATEKASAAFKDADCAIMLGAFPRKAGMERKELMEKNIDIFKSMGEAIEENASENIKVLVVGNPANTNALICSKYAPKVSPQNFTAMTRLDQHRAQGQVAIKANVAVGDVDNVIIWGNHSSTQYPDVNHGLVKGKPVRSVLNSDAYLNSEFIETIQKRGAAIINARKASSAMSAARAATLHMKSWMVGTKANEFVSMGVLSTGNSYGITDGLMYSFPCKCSDGKWTIVDGLKIDDFSKDKMKATEAELKEERELALSLVK